ncbi:uncharacterized protein [Rutidosis leptorrhynchoides]|uniref:uncharacterized protein n=1 Tax=Rutidosis leptorrhynchoides TaxID=125765 RepID=UPI003A98DA50
MPVRMFRPKTLEDAMSLARMQAEAINVTRKRSAPILPSSRAANNGFNTRNNFTSNNYNKGMATTATTTPLAIANTPCNKDQGSMTSHKCSGQLYALEVLADEEDEVDELSQTMEQEQEDPAEEVEVQNVPYISLNALTGTSDYQTMRVTGIINKKSVQILIDSGSTHNFLDVNVAKNLGCFLKTNEAIPVNIPSGNKTLSAGICEALKWQINGETFVSDVLILPIGSCEMVLGMQWLKILGDIVWNFEHLKMTFNYNGHRVELTGKRASVQWLKGKKIDRAVDVQLNEPKSLPPHRSCDHIIPLVEGSQPVNISASLEEHIDHLGLVLEVMRQNTLYAKKSKCVFATTKVEHLGHVISAQGVSTDPTKIEVMAAWPIPKNLKQLRGFLGLTGYYRRFIKDYALISRPLTQLLKKDSFLWSEVATQAFQELKLHMQQAPVLALPNFNKTFVIETDASGLGIGAVLQGHSIAFMSKALSQRHQALSTYDREFLAIVQAIEKLSTPTQVKWLPKLIGYDYDIIYKKGCDNKAADALSRMSGAAQLFHIQVSHILSDLLDKIHASVTNDATLHTKQATYPEATKHYQWKDALLYRKNKLVVGTDEELRVDIIKYFHDTAVGGHSGVASTVQKVCACFY